MLRLKECANTPFFLSPLLLSYNNTNSVVYLPQIRAIISQIKMTNESQRILHQYPVVLLRTFLRTEGLASAWTAFFSYAGSYRLSKHLLWGSGTFHLFAWVYPESSKTSLFRWKTKTKSLPHRSTPHTATPGRSWVRREHAGSKDENLCKERHGTLAFCPRMP